MPARQGREAMPIDDDPPQPRPAGAKVLGPGTAMQCLRFRPAGPVQFAWGDGGVMVRLGLAGNRQDGETFLADGTRSTERRLAGRMHVTTPTTGLSGWSRPAGLWCILTVHLSPALWTNDPDLAPRMARIRPRLALVAPGPAQTVRKLSALASGPVGDHLLAETLARVLLLELAGPDDMPAATIRGGLAPRALRLVTDRMTDALDRTPALAELAALAGLSPWHFCRAFAQATGLPPHRWLAARRMARAEHLLAATAQPILDIGMSLGFAGASPFAAAFRRYAGMTPTAFRVMARGNN